MLFGMFRTAALQLVITFLAGGAWAAGGDLRWQVSTGGVLAASNGRVVVAGVGGVQAFDGSSGTLLWQDPFLGVKTLAMDAQQVIAVGENEIRAYRASDGLLRWQDALASGTVIGAAEMKGSQLLVSGSAMDSTGNDELLIRAYDAKDGKIDWQDQSVPLNMKASTPTQKSLSVFGNRVYLAATLHPQIPGPLSCLVRAYDRKDGHLVWESISDPFCGVNAVAAHKEQVIVAGVGGGVLDDFLIQSYDARTGVLLWQDRTFVGTPYDNQAVAVDDQGKRAFVAGWVWWIPGMSDGDAFLVRAYNMQTGELYWEDQYPGSAGPCLCHARDIVVQAGRVFAVGAGPFSPFIVRAYKAQSGFLLWQDEIPSSSTVTTAAVAYDRGIVYAADSDALRAYAAESPVGGGQKVVSGH